MSKVQSLSHVIYRNIYEIPQLLKRVGGFLEILKLNPLLEGRSKGSGQNLKTNTFSSDLLERKMIAKWPLTLVCV